MKVHKPGAVKRFIFKLTQPGWWLCCSMSLPYRLGLISDDLSMAVSERLYRFMVRLRCRICPVERRQYRKVFIWARADEDLKMIENIRFKIGP